jgi:quercetin dioxygenase-like cupin family protein
MDAAFEQLSQINEDSAFAFEPEHPENFIGRVRVIDLAREAGLTGIDVLAVFFDADARTKPHVHQTEQLLYFVRGTGFVVFPGQEEQAVDEGGVVIIPALRAPHARSDKRRTHLPRGGETAEQDELETSRSG